MNKPYALIVLFMMYLLPQLAMGSEQQEAAPDGTNVEQTAIPSDESAENSMKKLHINNAEETSSVSEEDEDEEEDEEPDCA